MIHSHVSKDKTPVCVVMLNVSLWLISHENGTQSNRKDTSSNQCFRPEMHCELFLAGLVCGKEGLLSGFYKVSLTCDGIGELAWSLSAGSLALNTPVAPQGDLTQSQLVPVLGLFLLKEVQHQGSSWLVPYSESSEKTLSFE